MTEVNWKLMKLATNILFFIILVLSGLDYAQNNKTEVIIKTQMASSEVYMDGKLLNDKRTDLMSTKNITYADLNNIGYSLIAFNGKLNNDFNRNPLRDEYLTSTKKIFPGKSIFNSKDYKNIEFDFTDENEEELFYDKPIFKILLGSFVALGAATAYFKIKADKRFNDYKKTNNSSLLDETNKYDTISGVTFSLMQINFGVLVYYFLRE